MRERPHWNDLLTKEFFRKYYEEGKMSFPSLEKMLKKQGYKIVRGTIYKYCRKLGFKTRNSSEAKRESDGNPLDYNKSYLTKKIIEAVDGLLIKNLLYF